VPTELATICNRALHVDPEQRFSSALELRQALTLFRRHRGSWVLSTKASAKLDEMDAAQDMDERRMQQTMTECRFAFMQALEAWKGNPIARQGLDKVLARMIQYEIVQRDLEGARQLLTELSVPNPELEIKLEALAKDLEKAKADAERLQALAHDADLRIGARFQLISIHILRIAVVLAFFFFSDAHSSEVRTSRQLVIFPMGLLVVLAGVFVMLRKRNTTAIGRRAFALLLVYPVAMLLHRAFAIAQGTPIPSMLAIDMVFACILSLSFAISIWPRLAWTSLVSLGGAIAISLFPMHATTLFLTSALLLTMVLSAFWTRMIRNEKT